LGAAKGAELFDFLTRLASVAPHDRAMPDAGKRYSRWFYEYLHSVGVEHCNFGGFELDAASRGEVVEFNGTRLPSDFVDEFTHEMAQDDYVLLKADSLTADRPFASFDVGLRFLDEVEAFNPASRRVQAECARHGIGDGVAMIGNAPMAPGAQDARFFGFVFANREADGGAVVRERFSELQVASFALLDRMMPRLHATVDGFAYDLSGRQRDILGMLAAGAQRQEIAHRFDIAVPTVDAHLAVLRRKLGAQTLAEAVAKGYLYGIL